MKNKTVIKAATLNFSGINTNPFQYNDGGSFSHLLNQIFQSLKEKEFPELKKWEGVSIDKRFKENRFSIQNEGTFLQKLQDSLFTKEQFEKEWREAYESQKMIISEELKRCPCHQQVESLLKMDYSFYKAVVMAVYNFSNLDEFDEKCAQVDASVLKDFLMNLKNRPPFQLKIKKQMAEKYYKTVDVMFLQEAGTVKWPEVKGYTYIKNHDSMIIYKTRIFGEEDKKRTKQWTKHLDINQDTAVVITKNNFLLISSHFTSKNPEYLDNQRLLFKGIKDVLKVSEIYIGLKVITGMDANHFIEKHNIRKDFMMVPYSKEQITTNKKRTYIQAQLHKADIEVKEVKDHILTNIPIKSFSRDLVNQQKVSSELLPSDCHPFDHFIVAATLELK